MTSKEALETIRKDINEQAQVITTNPNLMVTFNVNLEMFMTTLENALKDLDRLEALEKENQELKGLVDSLEKEQMIAVDKIFDLDIENEKLKKIIKENFMYIPDALFEKVCFKWTGPVLEDEIIEVLNNET